MRDADAIDGRLDAIGRSTFRASFVLRGRERALVELRGRAAVRQHARELLATRLFPAAPAKDGRQTPYRGHPVFVAQHATGTCCRGCLERLHGIPKGRPLDGEQADHVIAVIDRWIARQVPGAPA